MRPALHQFRVYGPKNGLVLNQDQETLIKLRGTRYKSYVEKFLPPVVFAGHYLGNLTTNLRTFLRRDFQMKSGMKCLIESFYRSITEDAPLPIPYREILLTAGIMDSIFAQLEANQTQFRMHSHATASGSNQARSEDMPLLSSSDRTTSPIRAKLKAACSLRQTPAGK